MMSKNYFFKEKKKLAKQSDPGQAPENNVVRDESAKPDQVSQDKKLVQEAVNSASVSSSLNETARQILKDKERKDRVAGRFALWSDEEESPRKNEPVSRVPSIDETEPDAEQSRVDINSLLSGEAIPSCPVCSKKNTFAQNDTFIPHLKSCATKNHLSTEQLIRAIELHRKQANERTALGLPTVQEKAVIKRSGTRKAGVDANLELAMALSASLRESEMMGKMRETEILLEAGLEKEALSQCRKLEDFGFVGPAAPVVSSSRNVRKQTNTRNSVLFTRSKQERERILSEKIAIILIDAETPGEPVSACRNHERELRSKFLKKCLNHDSTLWTKSYHLDELDGNDSYYCRNLSTFVSPCKVSAGAKLRHVSQIPQRLPSPVKSEIRDFSLSELESLYFPREPEPVVAAKNAAPATSSYRPESQPRVATKCTALELSSELRNLSQAWKSLVNKSALSDVTIYAKNERAIHAHKLVLHVRCPAVLTETIKECENGKCREMLMWMNYDYETVIVFLEYLYSGDIAGIRELNEKQRTDLKDLSLNYNVHEVRSYIDQLDLETDEPIVIDSDDDDDDDENAAKVGMTEGEKNLHSLELELELEAPKHDESPVGSPEMFCNVEEESTLEELHLSSSEEEIVLPKAPEKRKSRSPPEADRKKKFKFEFEDDETSSDVEINFNTPDFSQLSISECSKAEPREKEQDEEEKKSTITIEDSNSTPDLIDENNEAGVAEASPYISPVWEGFENMNYDCVDGFGYAMETNSPRVDRSTVAETASVAAKVERRSNEPFFDSFDINVSDFDRLVDKEIARTQPVPSADFGVEKNITPLSVRKLSRRSKSDNVLTPVSKSLSDVTPMADYSNMKTKDLKKELDRYGLKPGINRNKAKKLLRYIYDQLHPYEDDPCTAGTIPSTWVTSNSKSTSDNGNVVEDKKNDSDEGSSQSSGFEFLEESSQEDEEDVMSQDVKGGTQSTRINLDVGFRKLLDEDKDLHQRILLYEPVWLESLKSSLKALNVKFSAKQLVNYLDEKCITYRTLQTRNRRKKKKLKPGNATQVSAR